MSEVKRESKETRVLVRVEPGTGEADVALAAVFPRHMVETLAKWSGLDLTVEAESLDGIEHHVVEDVAITLGRALRAAIDTGRVERVGHAVIPMDDALVEVAVDLVERPYYAGEVPDVMMDHFLRSLATEAGMTLHVHAIRGKDAHHVTEAAFKALGVALRRALAPRTERLSTKGDVRFGGATPRTARRHGTRTGTRATETHKGRSRKEGGT
ncbi:MAG TPA: imidazoleglycerol-phosphate dehydratase [Candidatus Thermoplasmatota archaeon]|nr:imidazoleglycerol-phosphate dehydratase [Candidatus Thermoplasmatota archaeon]